ncbi:helix-turn-helix domain-containing protein [Saccharopolyspora spinosa]|uniref:helix-turn-helix domain-containing protein n=1 Tax=Saccharopolyspora spinosa TaxID=60894 RepID=UPI001ED95EEB|nr:helix-turn-helix transcriptional regulator [Saccharopolyspora spinosa]
MAEDHGIEQDLVLEEDAGPNLRRRHLGRLLREIRQSRGRSLKEAATWSGLREGTISKMENGKQAIMPRNVRLLCQFYDVGSPPFRPACAARGRGEPAGLVGLLFGHHARLV